MPGGKLNRPDVPNRVHRRTPVFTGANPRILEGETYVLILDWLRGGIRNLWAGVRWVVYVSEPRSAVCRNGELALTQQVD